MKKYKFLSLLLIPCFIFTAFPIASKADASDWHAQWIWSGVTNSSTTNVWADFRKTVNLSSVPSSAIAKIAVDSCYWMWINGQQVVLDGGLKRGPNKTDTYYDEVDIQKYLKTGDNVIAIQVWYWGKTSSFSDNSSGKAGLLFEANLDGNLVVSDKTWKVKKDAAYKTDPGTDQPNYRLPESNIYYDARYAIDGWNQPGFDDSAFANATELGAAPCAPWNNLVKRPIPQFKDYGLKDYLNSSSYVNYTTTDTTTLAMKLPYNAQINAYLKIDSPAGKVIKMQTDRYNDGDPSLTNSYVTKNGVQEFEALSWFNGQVVNYTIPSGVTILGLKYRETGYDADLSGSFTSDDSFLNTLWTMSQRTLYVCMRDNYMDCPNRERTQWWGDTQNQMMMCMYGLSPSSSLLYDKAIATMAGWQDASGAIPTFAPYNGHTISELPMQDLCGVNGLWEYYLYTGQTDNLQAAYEAYKTYLNLWQLGSDGLVVHRSGTWDWADWGSNADVPALENAWYYLAVERMKDIAGVIGKTDDISHYDQILDSIGRAYTAFWTPDGFKSANQTDPDDRANAIAVLAGLANKSEYPTIENVFNTVQNASPYMEMYVQEAMCEMGYVADAQLRIKSRYATMVNSGYSTLSEYWDDTGSLNHAWSGGTMVTMSKYMAGVQPLTAGYATYQIKPDLGSLTSVNTVVPSIKGNITVNLKQDDTAKTFTMKVVSPDHTTALVAVPRISGSDTRVTMNGSTVFAGGQPANSLPNGVSYQSNDHQYIYFNVAPGTWNIESDVNPNGTATSYSLTVNATAGGSVKVNGTAVSAPYTAKFSKGSKVTLEAVPDTGYQFDNWAGSVGSQDQSVQIDVNNDVNMQATFEKTVESKYCVVHVNDPQNAGASIQYNGQNLSLPATLVLDKGEQATLTANVPAESGYSFLNWSGDIYSGRQSIVETFNGDANLNVNTAYGGSADIAKGAVVTDDDSLESGTTWTASNLTDGDITTHYSTNVIANVGLNGDISNNPHYIVLDLGSIKSYDTMVVYPRTDAVTADNLTPNFPMEFYIQSSTDGVNYDDGYHEVVQQNPNKQPVSISFDSRKARYIRLKVVKLGTPANDEAAQNAYRIQLSEIKVFSNGGTSDFTLGLDKLGSGTIKVNGQTVSLPFSKSYEAGTKLAIEEVPDPQNMGMGFSGTYETNQRVTYVTLNSDISLTANFSDVDCNTGDILLTANGLVASTTLGQNLPIRAYVSNSEFPNNALDWTVEDANGNPSGLADLINTNTNQPTLIPISQGTVYVVARSSNKLPPVDKLKVTITDAAKIATVTGIPSGILEITKGGTANLTASAQSQASEALTYAWSVPDSAKTTYSMQANNGQCAFKPLKPGKYVVHVDITGNKGTVSSADIIVIATDRTALNQKLASAKAIKRGNYSSDYWDTLQQAVQDAQTTLQDGDSIQNDFVKAISNIDNAISGYSDSSNPTGNQPGKSSGSNGTGGQQGNISTQGNGTSSPNTGDSNHIPSLILLAAAGVTSTILIKKGKKSRVR